MFGLFADPKNSQDLKISHFVINPGVDNARTSSDQSDVLV